MRAPSKYSCAQCSPFMKRDGCPTVKPGVPRSISTEPMPPVPGPKRTYTKNTPASGLCVEKILLPLMTTSSPSRVAVVDSSEIGRAHVGTPVTNAHLVCRLLLENKKQT